MCRDENIRPDTDLNKPKTNERNMFLLDERYELYLPLYVLDSKLITSN